MEFLNELKKEYLNNGRHIDSNNVEKVIMQIKNNTNTNRERMDKTLNEVKNAQLRVSELSESLRQTDANNVEISQDMMRLEERLISLERDNWKRKQQSEGNREKMEIFTAENKDLLCSFLQCEEKNGRMKKKLDQLDKESEAICSFIDKILESDKKLWKVIDEIGEKQRHIETLQKCVLNTEKYETALNQLNILSKYYTDKLRGFKIENAELLAEFEKSRVEYDVMKNSLDVNQSGASDLVAKMFTVHFKKNRDFLRNNVEDQEFRLKRLTELLEEESTVNSRLMLLLKGRTEENEKLREAVGYVATEVKDEIILLETTTSD